MDNLPKKRKHQTSSAPHKKKKPQFTVSIVVPDSILYNAQSPELRAYLVSQVARAAAIYQVDEVVILKDSHTAKTSHTKFEGVGFFTRNLEYLETPQYLRKKLFPMHPDLKFSGLLNPLDTPHHLRSDELSDYREGVTVERPCKEGSGSWVNIGLKKDATINYRLAPGTRVTVKLDDPSAKSNT